MMRGWRNSNMRGVLLLRSAWVHLGISLALLGALALAACGVTSGGSATGGSGSPLEYDHAAGHILIQLYQMPGFVYPPVVGVPKWTLYGDGTLIYRDPAAAASQDNPSGLLVAHLSADAVSSILDTVVNQKAFFASSRDSYGTMMPDVGGTLFTVSVTGKSKTLTLLPREGSSPDQQTVNVFSAQQYLLGYKAPGVAPYAAPGIALLVYQRGNASSIDPAARAWQYSDVSLATASAHDCTLLPSGPNCAAASGSTPALTAVYGGEALHMLRFLASSPGSVSQNGGVYAVQAYPLLPDSLHPDTPGSGAPGLSIVTASGKQRIPLAGAQPA